MALATQCPHCNTTFRVASDQLKLRGGIVRCGACNEVFDGNAALIDLEALAARQAGAPEPGPAAEPEPVPEAAPETAPEPALEPAPESPPEPSASAAFDAEMAAIDARVAASTEPIYTLDFDTTFDPFGILPKSALPPEPAPEPPPEPAPESESEAEPEPEAEPESEHEPEPEHELEPEHEPEPDQHADEDVVAAALPDFDHDAELSNAEDHHIPPLPLRESAPPEPLAPPEVELTPTASTVEPVPAAEPEPTDAEHDEPEFMKRGRRLEQAGRSRRILMGVASAVLLLALAAQGVMVFRNVLAARFPQLKPALVATCGLLACRVELPAQVDSLSVETGELQSLGGNTFSFTTLLRNQGNLAQAWPHIELALTDANDKPLLRRVFTPAEYLPQGVAAANGFAPRSEQPVKLYFELNQLKASGYHIAVFYP